MKYTLLADKRGLVYALLAIGLVLWQLACLYFVVVMYSTAIYSLSYYGVNYRFGFVRRGLAGALIDIFPANDYFTAAYAVMWTPALVWAIAVARLIWVILFKGVRSERRIMLALLVSILPFSLAFYVFSPRPELLGMAALVVLGIYLRSVHNARSIIVASALYGLTVAVLAFMHEAIPIIFALGAILAILVLVKDATPVLRWSCAGLAVGPGLIVSLLIAGLGRRNIASQLCAQLPHRMIDDPYAIAASPEKTVNFMLGREESRSDYHDFVCNVIKQIDLNFIDAVRSTAQLGASALVISFTLGLLIFVATMWLISYFSGVPVKLFIRELRGKVILPILALGAYYSAVHDGL